MDYRILDPTVRRSCLDDDRLAEAAGLGALRDAADRLSRAIGAALINRAGAFSIAATVPRPHPPASLVAGAPDRWGAWGELRIDGPGRWAIRSHDGTVDVRPGAPIA